MTGHITVKRLNKSGNYKSELDWDKAFCCDNNLKGLFKMVVCPIKNCDNQEEIRYAKVKGGYIVSGEGYIITGNSEKEIDKKCRNHYEKYKNLIQREVTEDQLW